MEWLIDVTGLVYGEYFMHSTLLLMYGGIVGGNGHLTCQMIIPDRYIEHDKLRNNFYQVFLERRKTDILL